MRSFSLAVVGLVVLASVFGAPVGFAQPPRAIPATQVSAAPAADDGLAASPPGRAALATIVLGFVLGTVGVASIITAFTYWKAGGATMLSFGLLTSLYGLSILLSSPPIAGLLLLPRRTVLFANAFVIYVLPVPGFFFAERVRGRGWLSALHWLWRVTLVLAIVFIAADIVAGRPWTALTPYRLFIVAAMVVMMPHVLFWRQVDPVESLVRTIGTSVLVLAIVHDNLLGFGLFPWSEVRFANLGVALFVMGLGFVTTRTFFANQRHLAAVERELDTARSIQTSILPHTIPIVTGLDMAVRYVPARRVAGDVYDFLQLDDHRLTMLVADVAGHGVPAALIASMAAVAFSAHPEQAEAPGQVLAGMNRVFCGHFDARFVTGACLFFDTDRRILKYSLAGHPRPIRWNRQTGLLTELECGGLVMGLFATTCFPSEELRLEMGDRIVIYTDGVSEALSPSGEWFGDRELHQFIRDHGDLSADRFADALLTRLEQWVGHGPGPFDDDLTIAVVDARDRP